MTENGRKRSKAENTRDWGGGEERGGEDRMYHLLEEKWKWGCDFQDSYELESQETSSSARPWHFQASQHLKKREQGKELARKPEQEA